MLFFFNIYFDPIYQDLLNFYHFGPCELGINTILGLGVIFKMNTINNKFIENSLCPNLKSSLLHLLKLDLPGHGFQRYRPHSST